jgi:hypothetical protein
MKYSFIQLRFLTKVDSASEDDHIIRLKRNGDSYIWIYSDKCKSAEAVWLDDREDVFHNLKSILKLLVWDHQPYYAIQVFAPGFPTVLIHHSKALDSFKSIKSVLNRVFDNWPENKPLSELTNFAPDEVYPEVTDEEMKDDDEDDDEDEDEDEECDDECDDMPKLIRMSSCPCTPNRPSRKTESPPARPAKSVRAEDNDAPASNTRSKKARLEVPAESNFYNFWS